MQIRSKNGLSVKSNTLHAGFGSQTRRERSVKRKESALIANKNPVEKLFVKKTTKLYQMLQLLFKGSEIKADSNSDGVYDY